MKSICVLGIFVVDLCFMGNSIPSKGQTILGEKHIYGPGGKGSNQAVAASKLGGKVNFLTKIGKDKYADIALNLYKKLNINRKYILKSKDHPTGVAGIFINNKTGENSINVISGASNKITINEIKKNIDIIKNSNIFLTQLETPYKITSFALQKAKLFKLTTILNPAPAMKILNKDFKNIDFFTPNETEASYYYGKKILNNNDIKKAAKFFLKKGVKNVVITLGSKGLYFLNKEQNFFLKAYKLKKKVIDTTGAGDAFNGALAFALSQNYTIKKSIYFSNKVAAISTTKEGAANSMPTKKEMSKIE